LAFKTLLLLLLTSTVNSQVLEGRFAASDEYKKYIAVNYQHYTGLAGFTIGGTAGTINRTNIFDNSYNPFLELNVGYRIVSGNFYGYIQQGAAYVAPPINNLMATSWQFPTSVSFGLQSDIGHLGIFWSHFSNGTTMKRNGPFEVLGIAFGKSF